MVKLLFHVVFLLFACHFTIFGGCVFEVWPAPGARESLQEGWGLRPHILQGLPGPPGQARPQKGTPQKSGQTAFRYPISIVSRVVSSASRVMSRARGRCAPHPSFDLLINRLTMLITRFTKLVARLIVALCYAIILPGRKSAFRTGFWPGRPISGPEGLLRNIEYVVV